MQKITAAILAGGKAIRLGNIVKGNLEVAGETTIIQHLLTELYKAGISQVIIVANEQSLYQQYKLPIVADSRANIGPLAGIEAALQYLQQPTIFLPCDLPCLTHNEIRKLTTSFSAPIVYAQTGNNEYHPLCVVIDNKLLPAITMAINNKERRLCTIWNSLGAKIVNFDNKRAFFNINTKEDLKNWRNIDEIY